MNFPKNKNLSETYICNGSKIEVLDYFLYEICIYKYWQYGCYMLKNKFLKVDKPLNIKHYSIFKKYKKYVLEKNITLIGAPYNFIIENNYPKFIVKSKKYSKNETTC